MQTSDDTMHNGQLNKDNIMPDKKSGQVKVTDMHTCTLKCCLYTTILCRSGTFHPHFIEGYEESVQISITALFVVMCYLARFIQYSYIIS